MSIRKMMWIVVVLSVFITIASFGMAEAKDSTLTQIGTVKIPQAMQFKDDKIQLLRFVDPDNPFIGIFFTRVETGQMMALANPSNTSIAVRLVAPVPVVGGVMQVVTTRKDDLIRLPQSVFSKEMKISRMYDRKLNTLCYIVYSTKWTDSSLKHNLSVVSLGMPLTK